MKTILYRKIFKVLNEDLNMILSDDDFEEPEIDLDVHIENIQRDIVRTKLIKDIHNAITNQDIDLLKDCIKNRWNGEPAIYPAFDFNLSNIVAFAIKALGNSANLNWLDVSTIKGMTMLFSSSTTTFNGDISQWDVSNVQSMSYMFYRSKFNGDISSWDVSNVTTMYGMFRASTFNGDISKWDVSNVTDMSHMFENSPFNGDISKWDVSNVTDMSHMFENSPFNKDISSWDISNVIKAAGMFDGCIIKDKYLPHKPLSN